MIKSIMNHFKKREYEIMKHINIILANATINNGNRGCVALSISSIYLLHKILINKGLSYTIYLPDSGFGDDSIHEININGETIKYHDCSYPSGHTKIESIKILLKKVQNRNFRPEKIFKEADYIFDIGQGDSFADIYGILRFKTIDRIHKIARKYNKSYCFLPQTIGPFKSVDIKKDAIESIEKAALCLARDKQSLDFVLQNAPSQKYVAEVIDVAFFMPYDKKTFDDKYIHVGLNVSALLWHGGYTQNNQFELCVEYKSLIERIITHFLAKNNVKVHLISHVVTGERHIENDYAVAYDLCEKFNNSNLILAPLFMDPIVAKGYIAGMDFFMGARMHATIAAFSSGVPVVPMAYSRKFNGLFVDTLQYPHMVDLKADKEDNICSIIEASFSNRAKLKGIITDRMAHFVEERRKLFIENLERFLHL